MPPAPAATHNGAWGATIGIALIVILLAAGGAYFFYMQQQDQQKMQAEQAAAEQQAVAQSPTNEDAIQNDLNASSNTSASGEVDNLGNSL